MSRRDQQIEDLALAIYGQVMPLVRGTLYGRGHKPRVSYDLADEVAESVKLGAEEAARKLIKEGKVS